MISNDILAQLQYDNDNDIQLTSIMIAHHSNLWQYTQWPTGYSPSLMIKVVATSAESSNSGRIPAGISGGQ